MRLASADFIIWLIIIIVVMAAKGFSKLATSSEDESEAPAPRPRPRPRPRTTPSMPSPRQIARGVPPVAPPVVTTGSRPAPPRDLRELMEQLTQPPRRVPAKVAPPPPEPPPVPRRPEPPHAAAPPAPAPPSRSAQWAAALRDRNNLRNIIISAEIIGPPKGIR